ncbi:MAG: chemotaxis protein CheW [Arcobacteraceae bacterium]|nr:chemotaxis protein CheW [Arcobacteraceae bacterium]
MSSVINKKTVSAAQKYLSFEVNSELYAMEILDVKEIIAMMRFTQVPKMPKFVKGVINLRGSIIPIIDMRLKFEMNELEYNERTSIIIGIIDEDYVGFVVDRTADVLNITTEEMSNPPKFGTAIDTRFLKSMAKTANGVVMVVDIKKIFTEDEKEAIASINEQII